MVLCLAKVYRAVRLRQKLRRSKMPFLEKRIKKLFPIKVYRLQRAHLTQQMFLGLFSKKVHYFCPRLKRRDGRVSILTCPRICLRFGHLCGKSTDLGRYARRRIALRERASRRAQLPRGIHLKKDYEARMSAGAGSGQFCLVRKHVLVKFPDGSTTVSGE